MVEKKQLTAQEPQGAGAGNSERKAQGAKQEQNGSPKGRPSLEKTAEVVQKLEASVEAGIERREELELT